MSKKDRATKKIYVLDTSALIHDPRIIDKLSTGGNTVVIPYVVIGELDGLKREGNGRAAVAREAARNIDLYRESGLKRRRPLTLREGVPTDTGGKLFVDYCDDWRLLPSQITQNNDSRILLVAKKWEQKNLGKVVVISRDTLLMVTADVCSIPAENTRFDTVDVPYSGFVQITLTDKTAHVLQDIHRFGKVILDEQLSDIDLSEVLLNQCVQFGYHDVAKGDHYCLAIRKPGRFSLVEKPKDSDKLHPINTEQVFAKALLDDPTLDLVTLSGKAGTGKTLISLLSAIEQVSSTSLGLQKVLVYRPSIEIGPGFGFLPGSLEEKFAPWTFPIRDNVDLILESGFGRYKSVDHMIENGVLEISPFAHVRGRSLNNCIIIIDEAQNLTPHQVKTVVTRAGFNCRVVLTGDPGQIDNPYVDSRTNGLSFVAEKFKGQPTAGHITLTKGERSPLAELAANLL